MNYTKAEAQAKYPNVNFYGDCFYIGEGAVIREGADISTVHARYVGNIYSRDGDMYIRIGCEHHTIADWDAHGAAYARKDGEAEWWDETGKYMYEYLRGEAERYQSKYLK